MDNISLDKIQRSELLIVYLIPIAICWVLGFAMLWHLGYKESFLYLNSHFWPPADRFMLYLTFLGDGALLAAICTLILVWHHAETVLAMLPALLISAFVIGICKYIFFPDWNRPLGVFKSPVPLHTVGNYKLYVHSFPSGHSIAVAAVFTVVVTAVRSRAYAFLLGLLTVLISYTRIYTGVHFLGDVLTANVLGTVTAILCLYFLQAVVFRWYQKLLPKQKRWIMAGLICLSVVIILINCFNKLNMLTY